MPNGTSESENCKWEEVNYNGGVTPANIKDLALYLPSSVSLGYYSMCDCDSYL